MKKFAIQVSTYLPENVTSEFQYISRITRTDEKMEIVFTRKSRKYADDEDLRQVRRNAFDFGTETDAKAAVQWLNVAYPYYQRKEQVDQAGNFEYVNTVLRYAVVELDIPKSTSSFL